MTILTIFKIIGALLFFVLILGLGAAAIAGMIMDFYFWWRNKR